MLQITKQGCPNQYPNNLLYIYSYLVCMESDRHVGPITVTTIFFFFFSLPSPICLSVWCEWSKWRRGLQSSVPESVAYLRANTQWRKVLTQLHVFEAQSGIGGVWSKTIDSTKLQTPKHVYQFSDFAWPHSVRETFPDHNQAMEYIKSYAMHFNILVESNSTQK